VFAAALLALGATATLAHADDFYWKGPVARGKTVRVKNINGAIHVVRAKGNQLEVTAIKTSHKHDPEIVKIEVIQSEEGVTFCALYPPEPGGKPNVCEAGSESHTNTNESDVWVAFKVLLPDGVDLAAATVNGEVEATGLTGTVSATTVNGSVHVETRGYAEANTVNGDVLVAMTNQNWPDALDFRTVNGSIKIEVPGSVNADLRAETLNGDIDSDFPITLVGKVKKNRMRGTIGKGGSELSLATVNGSIELRRTAQ
jgi:DUF4097 and DUF4098 domain-containing protein YvlB